MYADSDNGSVTSDDDIGVSAEGAGTSVHGAPEGLKFEGARGDDAGHIAKWQAVGISPSSIIAPRLRTLHQKLGFRNSNSQPKNAKAEFWVPKGTR